MIDAVNAASLPHDWNKTPNPNGDTVRPIAFRASSQITNITNSITARFTVTPSSYKGPIIIKGIGTFTYEARTNSADATTNFVTYPQTGAVEPFGNAISKMNSLIDWQFSVGGSQFQPAGGSTNLIYLTLTNPPATYYTVLDLACRGNSGQTDPNAAFGNIWCEVSSLSVLPFNGTTAMRYWGPQAMINGSAPQLGFLVGAKDGTCGAWGDLFRKAANAHGNLLAGCTVLPIVPAGVDVTLARLYVNTDAGQGGTAGLKRFNNHDLSMLGVNLLYDASYGTVWNTHAEWENAVVEKVTYIDTDGAVVEKLGGNGAAPDVPLTELFPD